MNLTTLLQFEQQFRQLLPGWAWSTVIGLHLLAAADTKLM